MKAPAVDWAGLSPLFAVFGGALVALVAGLLRARIIRETLVPLVSIASLGAFIGLSIWQWDENIDLVAGAMRVDTLAMYLNLLFGVSGIVAVLLSWRAEAPRETAHGEYYMLLLSAIGGMAVLVAATNTVTLFIGFELLSIPLYILCAAEMRRSTSLESGLKYLIIGSVGSATLVYGLALLYGATGSTDFSAMSEALSGGDLASDSLLLAGVALVVVGLAFKASVAPFHQWTPDVYQGAPTAVTAFMAVATKAAAFGIMLRLFDIALIDVQPTWAPVLATLATVTIVVGNVGALTQTSLKRLLAWSSVAQAGYLLGGVVVATRLGLEATLFYLAVYLVMNVAAFAVIIVQERTTGRGDHLDSVAGLGFTRPWLAWPLTLAMLGLAGIPATGGFIGKFRIIEALAEGGYMWLGVVIVLGSAVSLAYYLRVVAAMWMRPAPSGEGVASDAAAIGGGPAGRPALAGGSPELDAVPAARGGVHLEVAVVAVVAAAAILAGGVYPAPLFDLVSQVGDSLTNLL